MALSFLYATKDDVKKHLLGLDVSDLPDVLDSAIENKYITWAQRDIDSFCGQNFDLTVTEDLLDGTGSNILLLRRRPIREILNATLYVIPSVQWVQFRRWFYVSVTNQTGIQVARPGGVSPKTSGNNPPYVYPTGLGFLNESANPDLQTATFEDTEQRYGESDLFINVQLGMLTIPPRVLFMDGQAVPFWNYTWLRGVQNCKIRYVYGYSNPTTTDPLIGGPGNLPREITDATAMLACRYILLDKAVTMGAGAKTLTIDGVSRTFGELPYEGILKILQDTGYQIVSRYRNVGV